MRRSSETGTSMFMSRCQHARSSTCGSMVPERVEAATAGARASWRIKIIKERQAKPAQQQHLEERRRATTSAKVGRIAKACAAAAPQMRHRSEKMQIKCTCARVTRCCWPRKKSPNFHSSGAGGGRCKEFQSGASMSLVSLLTKAGRSVACCHKRGSCWRKTLERGDQSSGCFSKRIRSCMRPSLATFCICNKSKPMSTGMPRPNQPCGAVTTATGH